MYKLLNKNTAGIENDERASIVVNNSCDNTDKRDIT